MVRIRHEKLFHIVFIQSLHTFNSLTATILCLKCIIRHTLDVTKLCHGNYNILLRNQILHGNVILVKSDGCSSVITIFILNDKDFFTNHSKK